MTPLDVVHRLTQASTPYDEQAGRIVGALTQCSGVYCTIAHRKRSLC